MSDDPLMCFSCFSDFYILLIFIDLTIFRHRKSMIGLRIAQGVSHEF